MLSNIYDTCKAKLYSVFVLYFQDTIPEVIHSCFAQIKNRSSNKDWFVEFDVWLHHLNPNEILVKYFKTPKSGFGSLPSLLMVL